MSDNVLPAQMMTLLTNLTEHVGRLDRQLQEQRQPQLPAGIRLPPYDKWWDGWLHPTSRPDLMTYD